MLLCGEAHACKTHMRGCTVLQTLFSRSSSLMLSHFAAKFYIRQDLRMPHRNCVEGLFYLASFVVYVRLDVSNLVRAASK